MAGILFFSPSENREDCIGSTKEFRRRSSSWHSNTTLGPFAAAVTTGKLMGFDYETMEDAIACDKQFRWKLSALFHLGSTMKRARCGIGAGVVRAALFAAQGIKGAIIT